jgi:hypothetical protein
VLLYSKRVAPFRVLCMRGNHFLRGLAVAWAEKFNLPTDEVAAFRKLVCDRTYETRIQQHSLITLRAQHLMDADLIPVNREVRVNLDYDFKQNPSTHTRTEGS